MLERFVVLAALTALSTTTSTLLAQDEIVGLTDVTPLLHRQVMDGQNCKHATCKITNQPQVGSLAGGTAYDGRQDGVWVSNGTVLDVYAAPVSGSSLCKQICPTQKTPVPTVPGVAWYTTGMTFLQSGGMTPTGASSVYGRIYFIYNNPYILWGDTKGCQISNQKWCYLGNILGGKRMGGLACDAANRRLFVGATDSTGITIFVLDADNPCNVICSFPLPISSTICSPGLKQLVGLAYNSCSRMLYATDGVITHFGQMNYIPSGGSILCRWLHRGCCKVPMETYTGLAPLPKPVTSLGKSCTKAGCNFCPNMLARTNGQAIMGNPAFQVQLVNAPKNASVTALGIGLGNCATPGVSLNFCGNILISLAPTPPFPIIFMFGAPSPTPTSSCGYNLAIPLSVPVSTTLCKLPLSFQFIMACKGLPLGGNAVTNCLSIQFNGV